MAILKHLNCEFELYQGCEAGISCSVIVLGEGGLFEGQHNAGYP